MHRYPSPVAAIAVLLAALAGFVDAIAWTNLGGFFASFMSGNSTRMGVGLGSNVPGDARIAASLILAFLAGVIVASAISHRFPRHHMAAVLASVTAMLVAAAGLAMVVPSRFALLMLAAAMGAENGVFHRDGEVAIGLTYMTGTLVRAGQGIAAALIGNGRPWAWAPHLTLWTGFVAGTIGGARCNIALGLGAVWIAAAVAAVLTVAMGVVTRDSR